MFLQELSHGESHYLNSIPYMNGEVFLQEHPVRNLRRHGQTIRTVSRGVLSLIANAGRLLTNETKCSCRNTVENSSFGVMVGGLGIAIMRSNSTYLAVDLFIVARW